MSTELPVATRHRRDMTEKLLKATLNQNTHTHTPHLTTDLAQNEGNKIYGPGQEDVRRAGSNQQNMDWKASVITTALGPLQKHQAADLDV